MKGVEEQEAEIRTWMQVVLNKPINACNLNELLKDGVLLCELANKITGESNGFPRSSPASFVQMENISFFIKTARRLGVPDSENFTTVDLFEGKNMKQVMICLYSLSRNMARMGIRHIPVIGPELVKGTSITFTKEQLDDAKRAVSLQYGFIEGEHEL